MSVQFGPKSDDEALAELRREIDGIDDRLLELANRRAECAQEVAAIKVAAGEVDCFHRPEREAEVLRRMVERNPGPLDKETIYRLFRELMSECLALEKPLQVAFLGPQGTFSEQAAYRHFGHAIEAVPVAAIDEIFRVVESGACQYGVVPVENSTEGVITHTLDSFLRYDLLISGEVGLRIHQNLMSKGVGMAEITEVFSHQQSLAQCRDWLNRFLPNARRTAVASNSEAARLALAQPGGAAIAGEVAARLYGLDILERQIEDEANNATRFLVIGRSALNPTGNDKTTLLFATPNRPGALFKVLEPLARHGISMTKIESRPSRRVAWEYVFFVDVEGHSARAPLSTALAEVEQHVVFVKVLGSYPKAAP